jgi:hypothetical protein
VISAANPAVTSRSSTINHFVVTEAAFSRFGRHNS